MADIKIDENVVDVDKWVGSLERILEDVPPYMCKPGHPGRLGRIPDNLRENNVKAYEPYFMSIGPYHNGKPSVENMEKRKQFVLKRVLEMKPAITLKYLLKEMQNIEPEARSFYSDVKMESDKFVRMLLLDSLLIVSMFCEMTSEKKMSQANNITGSRVENSVNEGTGVVDDNETKKMIEISENSNSEITSGRNYENPPRWSWILFMHDLFLLENQLPFFVLEKIYNLVFGCSETQLLDTMKENVVSWLSNYTKLDSNKLNSPTEEVHHLLHLCHLFFHPTLQQESNACETVESSQMFRLGSAMQLYEAGITFEARSHSTNHSLLDITFESRGKLVMPCLYVDEHIDSLLRNLIALEQMKYPSLGLDVCAYVVLLLHLITTPEDVELLRRKRIIHHHLPSDKEMMYFINRLSVGLSFDYVEDKYSLKHVFHELKRYSERRVPRWRAWLKHRHFTNPWTVISLMVAALLLLFTVVQTFYTVYSYYHPYFSNHL